MIFEKCITEYDLLTISQKASKFRPPRPPPDYATCGRTFDTLGYAYTLRVEQGVDVLIGPACGDMSSGGSVASFATEEDIMVVSIASFQDQLNDVERYPTFTRIYESAIIQVSPTFN